MTLLINFLPKLNATFKPAVSSALANKTLTFKIYAIQSDRVHNTTETINFGNYQDGLDKAKIDKCSFIEIKTQL